MQQPVYNPSGISSNPVEKLLHLNPVNNKKMLKHPTELISESDDNLSSSDEFNINFSKHSSQDFGLGYWINHSGSRQQSPLPCHTSDRSVFISKSNTGIKSNDVSLSSSYQKPKRSKRTDSSIKTRQKSKKIKYKAPNIPKLNIPKHVIRNYLKTLSPNNSSPSSSSESESSHYSYQNVKSTKRSKLKFRHRNDNSESKSNSSSVKKDSSCLQKSFEKSSYSVIELKSRLSAASDDIMRLHLTIDHTIFSQFPGLHRNDTGSDNYLRFNDKEPELKRTGKLTPHDPKTKLASFYPGSNRDSLSYSCDIPYEENNSLFDYYDEESQQPSLQIDSICKPVHKSPVVNIRKRSLNSMSDEDFDDGDRIVSTKRKHLQPCQTTDVELETESKPKHKPYITPIDFVKFLTNRLKTYENIIFEKYCLSQPNAMKFLAQNHASDWESKQNNINQMHLVPCEFLNEIFHRALHCLGLEKKVVSEAMYGNSSPSHSSKCNSLHSTDYKKIRDEYSFSLKRVRNGIGVIDELFRRKVNYQNMPQNNDISIVRKWKHIIYYLCLHAKSAFMAKEIQYQYYDQLPPSSSFDGGAMDLCVNKTPSLRSLSIITPEMYNKPQLSKESSKLFDCKLNTKHSPEHCYHSDLEVSPHSYDSGKGSSIRMSSSNGNSLVSGCHTASSVNSTPHSNSIIEHELAQLHLPGGYQLFQIDDYQAKANEYVRVLPDAANLHQRIISRIGTEPNANSCDNMVKLIYYMDVVQTMSRDELMSECLARLLTSQQLGWQTMNH